MIHHDDEDVVLEEPVKTGKGGLALMSTGEDALDVLRRAGVRLKGDPEDPAVLKVSFKPR